MVQRSKFYSQPNALPGWVPEGAQRYLAHTEDGKSIRDLARTGEVHASTVMRQIRKIEASRDDPLIDEALSALGAVSARNQEEVEQMDLANQPPDEEVVLREARRILPRLCERGAVLAVAKDMEKAVVVRDSDDGASTRTAVVDRPIAQAMALNDWISCEKPGRISRYSITQTGRSAINRMLAEAENHAQGFAEAPTPFAAQHRVMGEKSVPAARHEKPARVKYNTSESPLTALARRRDKDGQRFLSDDMVAAGERLREDFELAQMGPRVAQNWDNFLTGGAQGGLRAGGNDGADMARKRVQEALAYLGEGLADVTLRTCCYLEGLETAERQLGWSARSGKIVLRIALIRLREFYKDHCGGASLIY